MSRPTIEEYREQLRGLTNAELVEKAGAEILGAAVLEGRDRGGGFTDDCVDACYDEAQRRGNLWWSPIKRYVAMVECDSCSYRWRWKVRWPGV